MNPPPLRIVIADDHPLFRHGVRQLLESEGFSVVGEAPDGERALDACSALHPDVVLLDVCMPRLSGMEALARLRERAPQTAAVLLTASLERREILEAVMLGARGVVLKDAGGDLLVRCIRQVAAGGYWVEHGAINDLVAALREDQAAPNLPQAAPSTLTPREAQIVSAVANGATNADIGRTFGLRDQTVKNHLTRIFDKLGVSTRLELAVYAFAHGLGEAPAVGDTDAGASDLTRV
jgi:two-component system, NarL family, nitrate/nitrite response regulator NarL